MSETMSNPTDQWMQFYNPSFSSDPSATPTQTSAGISSSVSASPATKDTPRLSQVEAAGGRVAKPVRRRSRASRRTPTTLLNTDTSNFRAMVQQFTGGSAGIHHHGPSPAFTVTNPGARPAPTGYLYYQQQQQQQGYPYMFGGGPAGAEGFQLGVGVPARPSLDSTTSASENLRSNNFMF